MLVGLILGFILGIIIGMLITSLTATAKITDLMTDIEMNKEVIEDLEKSYKSVSEEKDKLEAQNFATEKRAVAHFTKLFKIERIIEQDEQKQEFATFTLDKIKKLVNDSKSEN